MTGRDAFFKFIVEINVHFLSSDQTICADIDADTFAPASLYLKFPIMMARSLNTACGNNDMTWLWVCMLSPLLNYRPLPTLWPRPLPMLSVTLHLSDSVVRYLSCAGHLHRGALEGGGHRGGT